MQANTGERERAPSVQSIGIRVDTGANPVAYAITAIAKSAKYRVTRVRFKRA